MKNRIGLFSAAVFLVFFLWTTGALGYQLTFQPRISVGVEYTDNVFLDPDNIGELRDNPDLKPESDFLFVPTPGFTAEVLGRRNGLSLDYDFGYSYYNKYSERNSWRHNANITAWTQFSRNKRLELRNSFLYTEDPLGSGRTFEVNIPPDSVAPADQTTLNSRQPYWVNTADLRYTQQFRQLGSYYLEFYNSVRNDDSLRGNSSIIYTPRAGVEYWFNPRWGASLDGEYSWGNYDNAPDVKQWYTSLRLIRRFSRQLDGYVAGTYRSVDQSGNLQDYLLTTRQTLEDYKVYDMQVGVTYRLSNRWSLDASGGAVYYDPDITESKTRFSGNLNLTRTFRRGSARVYGGTGYGQAFDTRSDLGPSLFYEAGISGDYQLTRYLTANAFISYRRDEYGTDQRILLGEEVNPDLPELPATAYEDRTDDSYGASVGLSYELKRWASCELRYNYFKRNSTLDINSYDENRVTFYVTVTTPRPWRTTR